LPGFREAGFVVLVMIIAISGQAMGRARDVDPCSRSPIGGRAISFLESRPEVDTAQIGIWGTSYAGGHAIVLGGLPDRRLRRLSRRVTDD